MPYRNRNQPHPTPLSLIPYSPTRSAACCRQRCQEGQKYAFIKKRKENNENSITKVERARGRERESNHKFVSY